MLRAGLLYFAKLCTGTRALPSQERCRAIRIDLSYFIRNSMPMASSIKFASLILALLLAPLLPARKCGNPWGRPAGDVRSLASDPANLNHLFLGTSDGHIFGSTDSGEHWTLLGRAGTRLDSVVTSIVLDRADPRCVWAASMDSGFRGGRRRISQRDGGRDVEILRACRSCGTRA